MLVVETDVPRVVVVRNGEGCVVAVRIVVVDSLLSGVVVVVVVVAHTSNPYLRH